MCKLDRSQTAQRGTSCLTYHFCCGEKKKLEKSHLGEEGII